MQSLRDVASSKLQPDLLLDYISANDITLSEGFYYTFKNSRYLTLDRLLASGLLNKPNPDRTLIAIALVNSDLMPLIWEFIIGSEHTEDRDLIINLDPLNPSIIQQLNQYTNLTRTNDQIQTGLQQAVDLVIRLSTSTSGSLFVPSISTTTPSGVWSLDGEVYKLYYAYNILDSHNTKVIHPDFFSISYCQGLTAFIKEILDYYTLWDLVFESLLWQTSTPDDSMLDVLSFLATKDDAKMRRDELLAALHTHKIQASRGIEMTIHPLDRPSTLYLIDNVMLVLFVEDERLRINTYPTQLAESLLISYTFQPSAWSLVPITEGETQNILLR